MGFLPKEKLRIGENVGSGTGVIRARKRKETKSSNRAPGLTPLHEAGHAWLAFVLGEDPRLVEVRGNGKGVLGSNQFDFQPSLLVAAGGAALGDRAHAGGDEQMVKQRGGDWESLISTARSMMSGNMHVIRALASALEEWGALSGGELREVFDESTNGAEVLVSVRLADGKEVSEIGRAIPGTREVKIPAYIVAVLIEAMRQEREEEEKRNGKKNRVVPFPGQLTQRELPKTEEPITEATFSRDRLQKAA